MEMSPPAQKGRREQVDLIPHPKNPTMCQKRANPRGFGFFGNPKIR